MKFFRLLTVALLFLSCTSAWATLPLTVDFGIASTSSSSDGQESINRGEFRLGATTSFDFSNSFFFRTGGGFVQRGSTQTVSGITVTTDRTDFDIPLLAVYDYLGIEPYAGVNLSMKLSSSCSVSNPYLSCSSDESRPFVIQPIIGFDTPDFYSFRLGFFYEIGVDYQKNWNQEAFGFEVNYQFF